MRILKLFDGDYPWDVRVEKVVSTLLDAGHCVRLVCRNQKGRPTSERLANGLLVDRLPPLTGAVSLPLFFNPLWLSVTVRAARDHRSDLILVRDLPLTPLAWMVARLYGIPVVADLAEPYPDSLRAHFKFQRPSLADYVIRNPCLADLVERFSLPRLDHVLVVCPEAGQRLEARGLAPDRWTEVRNTPDLRRFRPDGTPTPELDGLGERPIFLFSGLLLGDRGLDTAFRALVRLRESKRPLPCLVIVGEGPVRRDLERDAQSLRLGEDVRFTGWIEPSRLPAVIARADVGLLPFHDCPHIRASLANKLFEYMALGLPVVVSDIAPMTRIVRDAGCGLVCPSGDEASFAGAFARLAHDREAREKMARAGRRAATLYNWEFDGSRLLTAVEAQVADSGKLPRSRPPALAPLLNGPLDPVQGP